MNARNLLARAPGLTRALRCAVMAATLVTPVTGVGQTLDYAALEQLFGEPVTGSATGSPQRESQVPATMIIVNAEDIRRSGARDIPGVLEHIPGLHGLRTGSDHADVSVRGYNQAFSPRLLVLVDGRQVYADYYGFTPWSAVPVELDAIRQIEVVKGPNSALYGFNAVGGVINIVTYDAIDDAASTLAVSGGTQGLRQASVVSAWKPHDSLGVRFSAGLREGNDFSTPLEAYDEGVRRGNDRSAANLDLQWNARDNLQLGVEATYSDVRQAEFLPVNRMTHGNYETTSIRAFLAVDTQAGLLQATVYSNDIETDYFLAEVPEIWLTTDSRVTVAQLQGISKIGNSHTLRLSAEYRHNAMDTSPFPGGEVFYDVAAFGTMWEWQIDPSVTLTTALRFDRWSLGRKGSLPASYPLTNDDWDGAQTEPSFNAAVVWRISDNDTVRFLVGRGVQLPNLVNLGGYLEPVPPFGFISGVPDLDPTVVDNYELSWERSLPALAAQLRVSAFRGHSRDIAAITGGRRLEQGLLGVPINLGDSRINGLDASLKGTLGDAWRWGVSYIGQEIDDEFAPELPVETAFTDFENTTPRHVVKANLGWARDRWEVDGYVRHQSGTDGILIEDWEAAIARRVPVSSYSAVDGRIGYAFNERVTLALSGQNLGKSEQRQTAAPEVERVVFATVTVNFGSR